MLADSFTKEKDFERNANVLKFVAAKRSCSEKEKKINLSHVNVVTYLKANKNIKKCKSETVRIPN